MISQGYSRRQGGPDSWRVISVARSRDRGSGHPPGCVKEHWLWFGSVIRVNFGSMRTTFSKKNPLRLLFTCMGRRVKLIDAFRRASAHLGIPTQIHGTDANPLAPARFKVDVDHTLPRVHARGYRAALRALVGNKHIDVIIPLSDHELPILASMRSELAGSGCRVLISSTDVVNICCDKIKTFTMLTEHGIDTPKTWLWSEAVKKKRHRYPYFLKPRYGSAAIGNHVVRNVRELEVFGACVREAIVQEYVEGAEHTLDVYTGLDGRPRCVVPRKRLEVRAGEVSKSLIVKDPAIIAIGRQVVEALGGCRGVVTVQCIVTYSGSIRVIEINPRFGGGVPLAIHAGADFPRWLLCEILGKKPRIRATGFRDDIAMLRYDESVFVPQASRKRTGGTKR